MCQFGIKYQMDYFRQKLLTYSTEKQMSTLLHIYTESNQPKFAIPMTKTFNYVDQILNDYSVKMYTYPDLSPQDNRLALGIHMQKKTGGNVFQFDQFKRKPLKKKINRRPILPLTPEQIPQKVQRTCPCCQSKNVIKHKCQHTVCQKPCSRMRRQKGSGQDQTGNRVAEDQEDFSPDRSQMEHEDSKSSNNLYHQSDFEEQIGLAGQTDSQSFLSNISKNKRVKSRVRTRKQSRRSRKVTQNPSRRSRRRQTANHKQTDHQQRGGDSQRNNTGLNEGKNQQFQELKELAPRRRRRMIKKPEPKLHHSQSNVGIQSQIELQNQGQKDLRRRRNWGPVQGKVISQNNEKEEQEINKKPLSFFCTPAELTQHQIFNIRIVDQRNPHKKTEVQAKEAPRVVIEQKIEPEIQENKMTKIEKQEAEPEVNELSNDKQNKNKDQIFDPDQNDQA